MARLYPCNNIKNDVTAAFCVVKHTACCSYSSSVAKCVVLAAISVRSDGDIARGEHWLQVGVVRSDFRYVESCDKLAVCAR